MLGLNQLCGFGVDNQLLNLASISVTSAGTYEGTPTVGFTGGGGTGATATANMVHQSGGEAIYSDALVTGAVGLSANGSGYTSAPTVGFSGGGGSGATGTETMSTYTQSLLDIVTFFAESGGSGSGYTSNVTIVINGGQGGSNATFTGLHNDQAGQYWKILDSYTVTNGGTGYANSGTIFFRPDGVGGSYECTWAASGGVITSVSGIPTGNRFRSGLAVLDAPTGGTGAVITLNWNASLSTGIWAFQLDAAGSGFVSSNTTDYAVSVSGGGGGTGWLGIDSSNLNWQKQYYSKTLTGTPIASVSSVTVTSGGSGYTGSASFTFTGGGGSGAAGTVNRLVTGYATTYYGVSSITVNNAGTGWTSAPSISFSGGTGSGASATAIMTG